MKNLSHVKVYNVTQVRVAANFFEIPIILITVAAAGSFHIPGFRSLRVCADLQDFFCKVCKDRCTES